MSAKRACILCGTEIGKGGKTGLCRPCSARANLAREDAAEHTIAAPVVAGLRVPESIVRPKSILEEQFDPGRVEVQDRPRGPGPKNDPTIVYGKDPKKHYRWVTEDMAHVARARAKGYKPVKREGSDLDASYLDHGRPDGYIGHDGLALMACPRELAEERINRRQPDPKEQSKAEQERSIEDARMKGIMTKQQADKLRGDFVERTEVVNTGDIEGDGQ